MGINGCILDFTTKCAQLCVLVFTTIVSFIFYHNYVNRWMCFRFYHNYVQRWRYPRFYHFLNLAVNFTKSMCLDFTTPMCLRF